MFPGPGVTVVAFEPLQAVPGPCRRPAPAAGLGERRLTARLRFLGRQITRGEVVALEYPVAHSLFQGERNALAPGERRIPARGRDGHQIACVRHAQVLAQLQIEVAHRLGERAQAGEVVVPEIGRAHV